MASEAPEAPADREPNRPTLCGPCRPGGIVETGRAPRKSPCRLTPLRTRPGGGVMKRLNGADALMLGMETSKSYMHTFKVAIIDPSTDPNGWSFDKFYAECARRIHVLPMLRWKYL